MRNMMTMVIYLVLADIFNVSIEDISQFNDLRDDFGMTESDQQKIDMAIIDMFDNVHLDFNRIKTVQDVVNQVVRLR